MSDFDKIETWVNNSPQMQQAIADNINRNAEELKQECIRYINSFFDTIQNIPGGQYMA